MVAAGLFAFIYFYQRNVRPPTLAPVKVFPELKPQAVTSVLIRPSGPMQLQIRVDRTNGSWQLSQPLVYPAQPEKVQKLLAFLEQLRPAPYLTATELRSHTNADEEFGFAAPQATFVIQQGPYLPRVLVGALTIPGDQVFLQVEGDLGAYVVDAELLKYLPHSADDWRDTSLLKLSTLLFDRIAVTNNIKADAGHSGLPASSSTFVLLRDPTNRLWRMVWPLDARANQSRIEEGLRKLQELRIRQFVSDDPKADMEGMGLAPAELELGFANGTNTLALLQFGRSPTNNTANLYAHRASQPGVFAVAKDLLLGWCAFLNDFRDPHLLSLPDSVEAVEFVHGEGLSSIQRQEDGTWLSAPESLPIDPNQVASFLSNLTNMEIIKFANDVVNPTDLPEYGLAPPLLRLSLKSNVLTNSNAPTNLSAVELEFGMGTNSYDKVFAKRTDESFVYAISTNDFARVPLASWQLRDRTLCHFSAADVTGLIWCKGDGICKMMHKGPLSWSFAQGSQGIINDGAVEETVRGVVQTSAIAWVSRGDQSLRTYGFTEDGYRLTLELKTSEKFELEFGGEAPSGNVYAAVRLENQAWILEFPWALFRDLTTYFPLSSHK